MSIYPIRLSALIVTFFHKYKHEDLGFSHWLMLPTLFSCMNHDFTGAFAVITNLAKKLNPFYCLFVYRVNIVYYCFVFKTFGQHYCTIHFFRFL